MRKLIMKMSVTVDGFVTGPNGKTDWMFKNSDEESRAWSVAHSQEAGLVIMGRNNGSTGSPNRKNVWATDQSYVQDR
jgi:dihydrofolate reductase